MGSEYDRSILYAWMRIEQRNPLKIFLRGVIERVNLIKLHYMHVWTYSNKTSLYN
jgi:hypothetical protein